MLGMLLTDKEVKEIEYLLKRELEELLLDLGDERIEGVVKEVMIEKYGLVFNLYKRVAAPSEYQRYALTLKLHTQKKFD